MNAAGARPAADCRARPPWALCALVFVVALLVRWSYVGPDLGAAFWPRPDALEYAAGAQSIAQDGRYYLQVGPVSVRPRYPPGFSLLLTPPLLLGVPGEELWRVAAAICAALATLLALAAWAAVRALAPESRRGPACAAAISGLLWAVSRSGVSEGLFVMSDSSATLFALLAAGATLVAVALPESRGRPGWAIVAGLAFGAAFCLRPTTALLLLAPLAVLGWGAARRLSRRDLLSCAGWGAAAATIPILISAALLIRSGESAWRFSAYAFWDEVNYGSKAEPFAVRHLVGVEPRIGAEARGRDRIPNNLEIAARLLLGFPESRRESFGEILWPAFSWLALVPLYRDAKRRGGRVAEWMGPAVGALAAWVVAHVLFWGSYFFPAVRFFGLPLALAALLAGLFLGLRIGASRGARRWLYAAAALALVPLLLAPHAATRRNLLAKRHEPPGALRARFATWRALADVERAQRPTPFDPVEAQALGLLPPAEVARIRIWGELPPTFHVVALRSRGLLPPAGSGSADAD